jgi:FKBP-type peptidyl-prolyl cis-trans isomerase 2
MSDQATNLLTIGFDDPYFAGTTGTTALVPGTFDVAIGGHPYMIDFNHDLTGFRALYFRRESIQALRQQSDTAQRPGEYSQPSMRRRR